MTPAKKRQQKLLAEREMEQMLRGAYLDVLQSLVDYCYQCANNALMSRSWSKEERIDHCAMYRLRAETVEWAIQELGKAGPQSSQANAKGE
jgi:hypothetical protein